MPQPRPALAALAVALVGVLLARPALASPVAAPAPAALDTPILHMLLSPRMPYALLEWPRMQRLAQQQGLAVQPWRDPRVPLAEWQAASRAAGLPALAHIPAMHEARAALFGLLHHAPSSLVGRCTPAPEPACRWHPWPILGVMPNAHWLGLLQHRLDAL